MWARGRPFRVIPLALSEPSLSNMLKHCVSVALHDKALDCKQSPQQQMRKGHSRNASELPTGLVMTYHQMGPSWAQLDSPPSIS